MPHTISSFIEASHTPTRLEEGKYHIQNDQLEKSSSPLFLHKIAAELLGTFMLVFIGCGSLFVNQRSNIELVGVAAVWATAVMALVYAIGPISGGHLNPAVTVAFAAIGRFPLKKVPFYIMAQLVGSIGASVTLLLVFEGDRTEVMLSLPSSSTSNTSAAIVEIIVSLILMFVICLTTDDNAIKELSGVAIGSTIFFNVVIAGGLSGCSMNPARSIGPAAAIQKFDKIWIYIFSPIIGTVAGSTLYYMFTLERKKPVKIPVSDFNLRINPIA